MILLFKRFFVGLALAVTIAGNLRAQTYILGSPDGSLNTDGWSLDSGNLSGFRSAITDAGNFGPTGLVQQTVSVIDLPTIDSTVLSGLNGLMVPWWGDSSSLAYESAIASAFMSGMDLWLLQDDSSHDGVGTALGISTGIGSGTASSGSTTFFNGAFGSASTVNQYGSFGSLSESAILATGGTVIARNTNDEITIAYWAKGAFSTNSGSLLIFTDVDMISNAYDSQAYAPTLSNNGILALNSTAVLVQAIPEPSTYALMLVGAGVLWLAARRRR